jgi:hypothetical protein
MQQRRFCRLSKAGKVVNGQNSRDQTCTNITKPLQKAFCRSTWSESFISLSGARPLDLRLFPMPVSTHACTHGCYIELSYRQTTDKSKLRSGS